MRPIPLVDLARRHAAVAEEVESGVVEVLRSGRYVGGPVVAEVERRVADLVQGTTAVGVASGTDALVLGLQALGVRPGDEVIVPALSFFATAGAVVRLGARPVVVDVTEDALLDPRAVGEAMSRRVRAVVPVHLFGSVAPRPDVDVPIFDDAAQALGAHPAPLTGELAAISVYPTKPWGAAGDGGFVAGGDAGLIDRVRRLGTHGRDGDVHAPIAGAVGRNSRLDAVQAAVLVAHATHLVARTEARRRRARRYDAGLPEGIVPLPRSEGSSVSQYCVLVTDRRRYRKRLAEAGIASAVYYPRPLHEEPALAGRCRVMPTPVAEHLATRLLALPVVDCDDSDVDRVLAALRAASSR